MKRLLKKLTGIAVVLLGAYLVLNLHWGPVHGHERLIAETPRDALCDAVRVALLQEPGFVLVKEDEKSTFAGPIRRQNWEFTSDGVRYDAYLSFGALDESSTSVSISVFLLTDERAVSKPQFAVDIEARVFGDVVLNKSNIWRRLRGLPPVVDSEFVKRGQP